MTKTNWSEVCQGCGQCCGCIPLSLDLLVRFANRINVPYESISYDGEPDAVIKTTDQMIQSLKQRYQDIDKILEMFQNVVDEAKK